jgi:hypothetical protein
MFRLPEPGWSLPEKDLPKPLLIPYSARESTGIFFILPTLSFFNGTDLQEFRDTCVAVLFMGDRKNADTSVKDRRVRSWQLTPEQDLTILREPR